MRRPARRAVALALLVLLSPLATLRAQDATPRRGVTAEDYFAFEFVSDPRISPDGRLVAYVLTTIDQRQNRRLSNIWLADADGARPPRQFTTSPQSSNSPRWSPDGRSLAFLSARPPDGGGTPAPQATQTPSTPQTSTAAPGTAGAQGASSAQAAAQIPAPAGTPPGPVGTATTPGVPSGPASSTATETPRAQVFVLSL